MIVIIKAWLPHQCAIRSSTIASNCTLNKLTVTLVIPVKDGCVCGTANCHHLTGNGFRDSNIS